MRIAVVGATGNKGSSVVRRLSADPAVEAVTGIARRLPALELPKVSWRSADIVTSDLEPVLAGHDAVIHLAWLIQPGRDESVTHAVNVEGSRRVFEAAARADVGAIVHASSIGAYSPGPKDRRVDESWPTGGIPTSFYSRHKAAVERILDSFESAHPDIRVVRLRPGLAFKREAGTQIRRLFAGPFLPRRLLDRRFVPVFPDVPGLVFQAVHAEDAAAAYHLAAVDERARGPYNIAAEPVLDPQTLADAVGARRVRIPARLVRAGAAATFKLRLQPSEPGWVDMGLGVPLMDTTRAREELGWEPRTSALDALAELLEGMRNAEGLDTPPLDPRTSGPVRVREVLTGVGRTSR